MPVTAGITVSWKEHHMSMLTQQPDQTSSDPERFHTLCAELDEYDHLPELMPGAQTTRLITEQSHGDTIDESILAGLTNP
jgi:hypothetical protein